MSLLKSFLTNYRKIFGISGLLLVICLFTAWQAPRSFLSPENLQNTVRWTALFGIISVGVSFVIVTGGIDLSIGSVVGLVGCLLAMFLQTRYQPEDQLEIESVDAGRNIVTVREDPAAFAPGQRFQVHDEVFHIRGISSRQITVDEPIETIVSRIEDRDTARQQGRTSRPVHLQRAPHKVVELGPVSQTPIRRGGQWMHSQTVVIASRQDNLRVNDQLQLLYKVGLPQVFPVYSIAVGENQTTIQFLIRRRQRVRPPDQAAISRRTQPMSTAVAMLLVVMIAVIIGLVHGLLITKIGLQPFIVTLCGLLFYRGFSRYISSDQTQGFGNEYVNLKELAKGDFLELLTGREFIFDIPMPFVFLTLIGIIAAIFLNKTIFGRYMLALGRNQDAARYSGVNTDRMVILAYMICSFCAGIAGILFALDLNSIQPSGHGEFYELYAIAAAVLGGCSLRGGEGSILGVIIAAAVMRVLNNAINLVDGIDTSTEFAIIGLVILMGVVVDEMVKRMAVTRRARLQARTE
ncbi:MAG: ABC transporter permease [Planctomycetaceae bacterium]